MLVGAVCFLLLVSVISSLNIMVYVLSLWNPAQSSDDASETQSLLKKVFNPSATKNASVAMTTAPLAGLLILYVTFRAKTQLIEEHDREYMTVQFGMMLLTGGILARAGDGLNVRLESEIFGNLSEKLGGVAMYIGYLIMLLGLMLVKSDAYTLSTAGKCFAALAAFVLLCLILIGIIPYMSWLNLTDQANDEKMLLHVQEVRSAASAAPTVMLLFFYIHFLPWSTTEELPEPVDFFSILCTVGVFLQGLGVFIKTMAGEGMGSTVGSVVRLLAVLMTDGFYFAAVYCVCLIEPPSTATLNFILLVVPVAAMKMTIVLIQEFSNKIVDAGVDQQQIETTQKLLQAMYANIYDGQSITLLISLLYLYIHFGAEFFLEKPGREYLDSWKGLGQFMYLLTISLYVLMGIEVLKLIRGVEKVERSSAAMAVLNVFSFIKFLALFVVVIAAIFL